MNSRYRILSRALATAGLALCSACAVTPDHPESVALPAAFEGQGAAAAGTADTDWYARFASPELDALLSEGAAGNLDLAAAGARMRQAIARSRGARASLLPAIDAAGSATRFSGHSGGTSATETDWSALLTASYELDFWGRNRATARSAVARAAASTADRDTALLSTRGAIASTYFEVLSLRERVAVAAEDLHSARSVLAIMESRQANGAASLAELAAQRAAVAAVEVNAADLEGQATAALGTLAVLSGHDPEGFSVRENGLSAVHEPAVDAGLPADLLRRRPDVLSAEATLAAARADLDIARTAYLPSIALTVSGGVQNPAVQAALTTLAGTGSSLSVGASILQSVFDGGRRRAVRAETRAREEEMLLAYRSAIRNALLDVESTLAQRQSLDAQRAPRSQALEQARLALQFAKVRYEAGSGEYLALLDAERTLHAVRDAESQYRLARLLACINLYKAIGGGWQ